MTSLLLVLMTVLLLPSCLPAQQREQHWLVGRWDGTIADYPSAGSPARTLEVTKVDPDGRAEAIWYITGQRTARAEVTVTASRVKVITVAKSIVDLTRDGESLVGTFVLRDGRSFAIKMTRRP